MEPFARLDAVAVPMATANVDTDQIIPARFLRKPRKAGYGQYLFHDLRFDDAGNERPDFVLNQASYRGARVLIADRNFGCGSSREHAVYALWDYGFRAAIAPSYGDIFYGNCLKNGFLPIVLPVDDAAALCDQVRQRPGARVVVDLELQQVIAPDDRLLGFAIDGFRKHCLLAGIDELDFTLRHRADIESFERDQGNATPWL
ncbi:MAG TPA: 3-isopropylmalate dehydratase small subunit [Stellaceae bacterium]|nr:3-isopropylmalate dehydratase small subunit [Stellaceae bacterium]